MTTSVVNIGCAVRGCTNPVIGQCTGYKGTCGRYYCADHSTGTLCSDCASRKLNDEVAQRTYEEYLKIAKGVQRNAGPISERLKYMLIALVSMIAPIGLGIYLLGATGPDGGGLFCLLTILGIGAGYGLVIWYNLELGKRMRTKAAEIDQVKPGFLEFYKARQTEQRKQAIKMGLAVAGIAAAAVAAGIADSSSRSSEEERIRNAVDDELRRRGH